jgi:hypothetical protein
VVSQAPIHPPAEPDVRILNPFAGRGYTSKKRAERYVRRGVARWVDRGGRACLQFVASGITAEAIALSVARNIGYDLASCEGISKLREMHNVPIVRPGKMMNIGKRKGATRQTFLASQGL